MPKSAVAALSSLVRFTQGTRLIALHTPAGPGLLAECVRGEEAISAGFRFRIDALSTDAHLSLRSLLGQPALLQLLTAESRESHRAFHGYVTAAELAGSDGGFARYLLTVEPWTAFMALGRDSRVFQDMDVIDILDTVFRGYQSKGRLDPAWRIEVIERGVYPKRSLTTQYQESDLAFVERLMLEEGLFYYFEHEGDPASASRGKHTMVIADHNGVFRRNRQGLVEFTRPGAVMKADSIDRWRTEATMRANAIDLDTWDYRAARTRSVNADEWNADGPPLRSRDMPGVYAYPDRAQGNRLAEVQLQALQARRVVHICAGTVRTLMPGTTFTLRGHAVFDREPGDEARTFLAIRVVHLMHNNLPAEFLGDVAGLLGLGPTASTLLAERDLQAVGAQKVERPLYRNCVEAILASVAYRTSDKDDFGQLLHPRPTVQGQQTAIVVGSPGSVAHTDRDHRIKVQFHWQRGTTSHSRLEHPSPEGHTGAPGNHMAGTWVRVVAPVAGTNWGASFVPRVGQEVLIDFLDGDIDRPVAIASLYNGRGQKDAQHNQVHCGGGAATGNAAPWFAGDEGGHAHPAVLSGFKSQAMHGSQLGTDAYSQLVFDDSPGQSGLGLQRHQRAHDGMAELNLGYLRHRADNQRLETVGAGAELKTAHAAALRAGDGLLLAAGAQDGTRDQLGSAARGQVEQCCQLQQDLAKRARDHQAVLPSEPSHDALPALAAMRQTSKALAGTAAGRSGSDGGDSIRATAYGEALLQLWSPAGIVAVTPANVILSAEQTGALTAGGDVGIVAQGNISVMAVAGISLFSYGKADDKARPLQETGMKFHAASGRLSLQSQSGASRFVADKSVTVASITKSVTVRAPKKHVLLTAQGACIRLEGGNIEVHAPGKVEFKAGKKELGGPQKASSEVRLPQPGDLKLCEMRAAGAASAGDGIVPVS
ncbi:type VI secretion system Vgr family protein [Massilia sp. CFBP9012]|uniref:type VI secretion system Vgr family protein n=1 Tax=Massilia sp. CFBP9012 TaxID=3096531 RepID=UPI002A69C803|nr:type VI secretion system Vgr family protein [Massilia sp. CFBP9012]MDY0973368.1 type VI secretion system Vgr family protein [Massilia sp. CFBP9012]